MAVFQASRLAVVRTKWVQNQNTVLLLNFDRGCNRPLMLFIPPAISDTSTLTLLLFFKDPLTSHRVHDLNPPRSHSCRNCRPRQMRFFTLVLWLCRSTAYPTVVSYLEGTIAALKEFPVSLATSTIRKLLKIEFFGSFLLIRINLSKAFN